MAGQVAAAKNKEKTAPAAKKPPGAGVPKSGSGSLEPKSPGVASEKSSEFDDLVNELVEDQTASRKSLLGTHWLIDSKSFQTIVYTAIILNSAQMGMYTDYQGPGWDDAWLVCEHVFTSLFTVEMVIKLAILKQGYFQDSWNRMDFVLVWMSIIDGWLLPIIFSAGDDSPLGSLRVLRILRVMRMARLLRVFKELFMIIKGIIDSLRTMFWISMLLLLILYVCSILVVEIIGRAGTDVYPARSELREDIDAAETLNADAPIEWNSFAYFGTVLRSMYSLFSVVIMAEWPEMGRPLIEKQPYMFLFFVVFIVFTTFGVMNVIIGVIVDNTMEAAKAMAAEGEAMEKASKLALLGKIQEMVFSLDADGSGEVSVSEIEKGMQIPAVKKMFDSVHLPKAFAAEELMALLDGDGDGSLTADEFMKSFFRLIDNNEFQANCLLTVSLNEVKKDVRELREFVGDKDKEEDGSAEKDDRDGTDGTSPTVEQTLSPSSSWGWGAKAQAQAEAAEDEREQRLEDGFNACRQEIGQLSGKIDLVLQHLVNRHQQRLAAGPPSPSHDRRFGAGAGAGAPHYNYYAPPRDANLGAGLLKLGGDKGGYPPPPSAAPTPLSPMGRRDWSALGRRSPASGGGGVGIRGPLSHRWRSVLGSPSPSPTAAGRGGGARGTNSYETGAPLASSSAAAGTPAAAAAPQSRKGGAEKRPGQQGTEDDDKISSLSMRLKRLNPFQRIFNRQGGAEGGGVPTPSNSALTTPATPAMMPTSSTSVAVPGADPAEQQPSSSGSASSAATFVGMPGGYSAPPNSPGGGGGPRLPH